MHAVHKKQACARFAESIVSSRRETRDWRVSRKANLGLDPAGVEADANRLVVKLLRALGGCLGIRRR